MATFSASSASISLSRASTIARVSSRGGCVATNRLTASHSSLCRLSTRLSSNCLFSTSMSACATSICLIAACRRASNPSFSLIFAATTVLLFKRGSSKVFISWRKARWRRSHSFKLSPSFSSSAASARNFFWSFFSGGSPLVTVILVSRRCLMIASSS